MTLAKNLTTSATLGFQLELGHERVGKLVKARSGKISDTSHSNPLMEARSAVQGGEQWL